MRIYFVRFILIVTFPFAALGALFMGEIKELIPTYRALWSDDYPEPFR